MNALNHPVQRTAGLILAALALFVLDPQQTNLLHGLLLPLVLAAAAFLMTRSSMAVLIAVFALSVIAMDVSADHWLPGRAYPTLAIISFSGCLYVVWQRLQARARATHDERWAERRQ